jgi:ADP-ribose pyrophosphatase
MSELLKWKLLSTEYIHKGKWATLRIDKCEMPNGVIVDDYYVLEYDTWVNGVAITKDNEVLMVKQYRHAADIISLEIPGGVVDEGEKPQEAFRRELLEETGYQFDDFELLCTLCPNPSTGDNRVYSYLAKGGVQVQEQALDDHEDLIVEKYTIEEIKQLLLENKIDQAMHCTALFYALVKLGAL